MDLMNRYDLLQMVNKPTRGNNILDLMITDNPGAYDSCDVRDIKPHSDHKLVTFMLSVPGVNKRGRRKQH